MLQAKPVPRCHRQDVTPTVRPSDPPKVTLQAKALPPPGPAVFPCSITSPALQAAVCPGGQAGPPAWSAPRILGWECRLRAGWKRGARRGQPGHEPAATTWVCMVPSWPGSLPPWKLIISELLGRTQPLKILNCFMNRAHAGVCGCDSWLNSGLILQTISPVSFPAYGSQLPMSSVPVSREPRARDTKCVRLDRFGTGGWGAGQTVDHASPTQRRSNSIKNNTHLTASCSTLVCQFSGSAWELDTLSPSSFPPPPLNGKEGSMLANVN